MPMVGMKNIINAAAMNGYNVRLVSSNAPRNVAEGEREREGGGEEKIADNVAEEKGETIGKTLVEREQQPKKTIQKKQSTAATALTTTEHSYDNRVPTPSAHHVLITELHDVDEHEPLRVKHLHRLHVTLFIQSLFCM